MSRAAEATRALRPPRLAMALVWAVLAACGPAGTGPEEEVLGESAQPLPLCYCPLTNLKEAPSPELIECYYACDVCGDGYCDPDYESSSSCPTDCGPASWCGNGACESGENESNCAADCYCGDGWCNGETIYTCPADCGCPNPCGNGVCGAGESTATCPADCGSACGDGACNGSETVYSCNADCGYCGDGYCASPETRYNCSLDCDPYYPCLYQQCPIIPVETEPAPER